MATTGTCRHCHQPITWIRVNANTGYWAPTVDLQHTDRPWGGCLSRYPGEGHNTETSTVRLHLGAPDQTSPLVVTLDRDQINLGYVVVHADLSHRETRVHLPAGWTETAGLMQPDMTCVAWVAYDPTRWRATYEHVTQSLGDGWIVADVGQYASLQVRAVGVVR